MPLLDVAVVEVLGGAKQVHAAKGVALEEPESVVQSEQRERERESQLQDQILRSQNPMRMKTFETCCTSTRQALWCMENAAHFRSWVQQGTGLLGRSE